MVAQDEGQTVLLRADDDHLRGKRREGMHECICRWGRAKGGGKGGASRRRPPAWQEEAGVDGGCARAGEGEEERAGER